MVSDKVSTDEMDEASFKSNFARSMAVNSQFRQNKSQQLRQQTADDRCGKGAVEPTKPEQPLQIVRMRKEHLDAAQRYSCGSANSSRRTSLCFSRIPEQQPVESFILQSQIDTLQWQLKETESSREMYRAVMKQVVMFLERAHRSLELLGTRIGGQQRVSRTQSDYHVNSTINGGTCGSTMLNELTMSEANSAVHKEISWRRLKKQDPAPDEIPPEKLSQEAFRLLRTAQSLLSTHEPDLARASATNPEEDITFLAQLAKEFPAADPKPQRTTSFSLCPKLLTPEKDLKTTAFNRKLSLQLHDPILRRPKSNVSSESSRSSVAESECILSSTLIDDNRSLKSFGKSSSPPVSSVGSDESGFSSMNSFQEVGLPQPADPKETLFKSMLSRHAEFFSAADDVKLWQTPNVVHKRWSSIPTDTSTPDKPGMKVLWV